MAPTISELCDRYLSEHVAIHNKASTARDAQRIVEKRIRPAFGQKRVSDLTRSDIKKWHQNMKPMPHEANRSLAYLSKMIIVQLQNFAQEMKLTPWVLPAITDKCGSHLTYQHFIECAETWRRSRIDNVPKRPATYVAMRDLCVNVLDPVIDHFGSIELTYGFASAALSKSVQNVTPRGDQHAGCELNRNGNPFCPRLGQGVDFRVPHIGSLEVAHWINANTPFDRLYFYADDRPFHVSFGPDHSRLAWHLPKLVMGTGARLNAMP